MHNRKPLIATAAIAGIVLLLIGGGLFTLETRWFSGYLSEKLTNSMGQNVSWAGPLHIDWSLNPTVRIEQPRIDNPEWARHEQFAAAEELTARIALPKLVQGVIAFDYLQLDQPRAHLMESAEFGRNWSMFISDKQSQKEPLFTVTLRELMVIDGRITYLEPAENTDLNISVSSPDGEQLKLTGDGQLQGEPLQLRISSDPLDEIVSRTVDRAQPEPAGAYSLVGRFEWKDHRLHLDGTTGSLTELKQLQFDLKVEGSNAQALAQLIGADAYAAPYQLQAHVELEQKQWTLKGVTGEMGKSTFAGDLRYDTRGKRPAIEADFDISAINLDRFSTGAADKAGAGNAHSDSGQTLTDRLHQRLAPLRHYDAKVIVDIGRLEKEQIVVLNLQGDVVLDDGTLTVERLRFDTGGGQVLARVQVNASHETPRGEATVEIEAVDLGEALAHAGDRAMGNLTGEVNVRLDKDALLILDSDLHYWNEQNETDVETRITSHETDSGASGIRIDGDGKMKGNEMEFELVGGPLLEINSKSRPYPLEAALTLADTTLNVDGTLTQPLQITDADLQLRAKGPDPAQLNQLAPLNLPHLPEYELSGHFLREDSAWYLRDIRVDLGASDLAGNLRWARGEDERMMVWGDLHSQEVHMDTLTANNNQQASPDQSSAAEKRSEDKQVLPSEELPDKVLQSVDAHVEYNAKRVVASDIPLDNMKVDLTLQDGVLQLSPLSFGIGDGTVKLDLQANGTTAPLDGNVNLDVTRVGINDLLAPFDLADESFGLLGGEGEFNFKGNSVAQALGNLQGEMHLIMNGGWLDATMVETLGLDAGELLAGLFGGELNPDKVQCAYLKLDADDGVTDIKSFTIATAESNVLGDGQFDLEQETFELVLEAHPKDFSVISGSSPIRLHGTFNNLQVDVVSDELAARGVLAAIGAAVFPPAALLPLVEPGETEGQNGCEKAVASAESVVSQ